MSFMASTPRPFFQSSGQKSSLSFEETPGFKFGISQSETLEVFFWVSADLIAGASERSRWPIDGLPLKLNPDSEASVRQSLAVNHAGERTQVTDHGADHDPLIKFPGFLCQDTHPQRTPQ